MIRALSFRYWRSLPAVMQIQYTAWEHAGADVRCGRCWVCVCAACRQAREASK